jgi:TDG/mug DNA glycosylase family protein
VAFARPRAPLGRQPECLESAGLWLLPNTSGLNANHQLAELAAAFAELRQASPRLPDCRPHVRSTQRRGARPGGDG